MPPINPETVPGGMVIPNWLVLTVIAGQQVVIWKLVMMGRSDLKTLLPALREANELLREVKEFLK